MTKQGMIDELWEAVKLCDDYQEEFIRFDEFVDVITEVLQRQRQGCAKAIDGTSIELYTDEYAELEKAILNAPPSEGDV